MQRNEGIESLLRDAVGAGDVAGVVAVEVDERGLRSLAAAGNRDVSTGEAMSPDTIFYIASMTKAVTSVAAMQLVERGALSLDDPIGEIVPALADPPVLHGYGAGGKPILHRATRPVTLRRLLTHTSGLAYTMWNEPLFEYRRRHPDARPIDGPDVRLSAPLVAEPGSCWQYGTSTDWVGIAVEAASGMPLDRYFREHVFDGLEMPDSDFRVPAEKNVRVASKHRRTAQGSLTEEPRAPIPEPELLNGGGGLYSTAIDYAHFLRSLLPGNGTAVVSEAALAEMGRNQIGGLVAGTMSAYERERSNDVAFFSGTRPGWGLGFLINPEPVTGGRASGSLAWGGLFNTYFWVDPASRLAGALFTQILPFCDARVLALFDRFERAVYAGR